MLVASNVRQESRFIMSKSVGAMVQEVVTKGKAIVQAPAWSIPSGGIQPTLFALYAGNAKDGKPLPSGHYRWRIVSDDIVTLDRWFGFKDGGLEGNREGHSTNVSDIINRIMVEGYNPQLGRLAIDADSRRNKDGGHRYRALRTMLLDGRLPFAIVDVLVEVCHTTGFDVTQVSRSIADELTIGGEGSRKDVKPFAESFRLCLLRFQGYSLQQGGKAGKTWKGQVLRPDQLAALTEESPHCHLWNTFCCERFQSWLEAMKELGLKGPSNQWLPALYDVVGDIVDVETLQTITDNFAPLIPKWNSYWSKRGSVKPHEYYPTLVATLASCYEDKVPQVTLSNVYTHNGLSELYASIFPNEVVTE